MVAHLEGKVVRFAILSRILVVFQLVICSILPRHEADIFSPPVFTNNTSTATADRIVLKLLTGFTNWDSRYFLFVTNYGYVYENTLVFLPLFPFLTTMFSYLLYPLRFCLSTHVLNLISGIILNNICFVITARQLYVLGCRVVGDNSLAYKAALIFCFNPASVFFSTFYSESLFFLLSTAGFMFKESGSYFTSLLLLSLTSACRSNGVLFAFFFIHTPFQRFINSVVRAVKIKSMIVIPVFFSLFIFLVPSFIALAVVVSPFLTTQIFAYRRYCTENVTGIPQTIVKYGVKRNYLIVGSRRPDWCNSTMPLAYGAIQSSHWNLGFMNYFEMKQLPNFLLATPVVLITIGGIMAFVWNYPTVMRTAGFLQTAFKKIRNGRERMIVRRLTPYVFHLALILIFLSFNIHVQVLTRLIFSSTPCIYWIVAYCICDRIFIFESENNFNVFKGDEKHVPVEVEIEKKRRGNLVTDDLLQFWHLSFTKKTIFVYFISYFLIGIYMHGTCLPWT